MTKFEKVLLPMRPEPQWPTGDLRGPDRGANCYSGAQMLEYGRACAEAQREADAAQGDRVSKTVTEPAKLRKEFREQFDLGAALDDIKERLDKLEEKRMLLGPETAERHETALRELAKRIDEIAARIDAAYEAVEQDRRAFALVQERVGVLERVDKARGDIIAGTADGLERLRDRVGDIEELERVRASFHAAAEKFAR